MTLLVIVVLLLGVNSVADADWPFTTHTSLYCRVKCVDTWFGYHDTWLKYVECDVKLPGSEKLYCVEMPQPWIWFLVLGGMLAAVCSCIHRCCGCGGCRRYEAVSA